jgi:hypothetical protein
MLEGDSNGVRRRGVSCAADRAVKRCVDHPHDERVVARGPGMRLLPTCKMVRSVDCVPSFSIASSAWSRCLESMTVPRRSHNLCFFADQSIAWCVRRRAAKPPFSAPCSPSGHRRVVLVTADAVASTGEEHGEAHRYPADRVVEGCPAEGRGRACPRPNEQRRRRKGRS